METVIARTQYGDRGVLPSDLSFEGDKGVTKQADAQDCDINAIFKKYERCGQLPDMILKDGRYGDFSAVPDYQSACELVKNAEQQFAALDVTVRNRFANDPSKFLAFATDEKNYDELEKMGLLKPEVVAERLKAKQVAGKADLDLIEANRLAQLKADLAKIKA